jgi:hypothetical protein
LIDVFRAQTSFGKQNLNSHTRLYKWIPLPFVQIVGQMFFVLKQVALLTKELEIKQQQVRSSFLLVPDLALFHFGCLVADITSA